MEIPFEYRTVLLEALEDFEEKAIGRDREKEIKAMRLQKYVKGEASVRTVVALDLEEKERITFRTIATSKKAAVKALFKKRYGKEAVRESYSVEIDARPVMAQILGAFPVEVVDVFEGSPRSSEEEPYLSSLWPHAQQSFSFATAATRSLVDRVR